MRLLICGDRNWTNKDTIIEAFKSVPEKIDVVIEGECRGADVLGAEVARSLGIPVSMFPADWARFGRAAGPQRNIRMVVAGKPTHVWAFHNHLSHSKGTKNMISYARSNGIPVTLFSENAEPKQIL